MKTLDIYDYAESNYENESSSNKNDRGMQIKIAEDKVYVIVNQIKINAYSTTYSAIKIKGNKSNKNIKKFKKLEKN